MTRTSVRAELVRRWSLLSAVTSGYAAGAQPVQVTRFAPDPMVGAERILVDSTDGTMSIPTMRAGTKTTQDEFEVSVFVSVAVKGWTAAQVEDRCVTLVEAILDDLGASPTLDGRVTGLAWCRAGRVRMSAELLDNETPAHVAELTLEVMTRTTG